jgi:hypothetical protein
MSKGSFEFLQPKNGLAAKGYSNGVAAEKCQVFIAGHRRERARRIGE